MSHLIRARPLLGRILRPVLINRTFASRTQYQPTATKNKPLTFAQYRWISIGGAAEADSVETKSISTNESSEPEINLFRSPNIRSLDRAFATFEEKCQRNERVDEKDFAKTFDLFTRVIRGLGSDVGKIDSEASSNIILYTDILLRCCGKLMVDTPPKGRELLAGNLWIFIKEASIPLDISHYNSLLRVMNENETSYDPSKLVAEIKSHNLEPDRITYQRLIHQYCLQGDIANATGLLEKMKNSGLELSEQIFASLIIGYSKQSEPPTIAELFDLMRSNKIDPSGHSYSAAFVSLADRLEKDPKVIGEFDQLCNLYEQDEAQLTTNDIIDLTLNLSKHRSKYPIVDKFLTNILSGFSGSVPARYRMLTSLVRVNELERASELFWSQKINERTLRRGNVGSYWIRALAINRNVPTDFAIKQCELLKEREYNQKPLYSLYFFAAEAGHLDLVRAALKTIAETEPLKIQLKWPLIAQAKSESELIEVMKNDIDPLMNPNDLMETFSSWIWPKFANNVQRLFELNKELGYDNNILMASFLNYSVQENKFMEALKFISEAPKDIVRETSQDQQQQQDGDEETTENEVQVTPRAMSRLDDRANLIARLLNQIVDQTKDPQLVSKAFNMCQVPGQPANSRSLAALVRAHLVNDDYDAALEEFLRIFRAYRVVPCRAELMRHCLETKNPERLQKIMNCVTELYGEHNSLFDLAVCCLKSGKLKQAQKIFSSPGFRVRPIRIYQTCRSIARQGDIDVLENFVNLTRDMYDVNQEYLYQVLIDTYDKSSNAKRALHLWNMMQEEEFQPSKKSLIMIANILERNNIEVPFQKPKASYLEGGRGHDRRKM